MNPLLEAVVENAEPAPDTHTVEGWIRDVDALCVFVRHGLAPLVAAKLVTLVEREFSISEPTFGTYVVAGLEIALVGAAESRVAVVRPWGLSLLGAVEAGVARALNARGRVDLECGEKRVILLRFDDWGAAKWVAFIGGEARALDEKAFFELLSRVTEVRGLVPSPRTAARHH